MRLFVVATIAVTVTMVTLVVGGWLVRRRRKSESLTRLERLVTLVGGKKESEEG